MTSYEEILERIAQAEALKAKGLPPHAYKEVAEGRMSYEDAVYGRSSGVNLTQLLVATAALLTLGGIIAGLLYLAAVIAMWFAA